MEGSAATGLGYIDYLTKSSKDKSLIYPMRKKRLAFSKFSFIMASGCLILLEIPSTWCLVPLVIGTGWSSIKIGTQISYNLTPDKFFLARTFLSIYNLVIVLGIWYKFNQSRKDKVNLEMEFVERVNEVAMRVNSI